MPVRVSPTDRVRVRIDELFAQDKPAEEDFTVACRMLDQIEQTMTLEERVCHTWVKYLLRGQGCLDEYAAWKLVTYRRFCPEFNWVPIPEKAST